MAKSLIQGKYKILSLLGRGGMGAVYRVRHEGLHREDALKKLHEQYAEDTAFVDRFMREARAMARLDHPNIIRIYDVFSEDDASYIAMEYFHGDALGKILTHEKRLDLKICLSIIKQLASALSYAHKQGIVHRDIKPGNILVNPDYTVKIADFGIAAVNDEHTLTTTGQMVGSPRYMSPEQAKGKGIDQRSDLFSLGMVFYEMVSGNIMYQGDSSVAIIGKLAFSDEDLPFEFPEDVPEPIRRIVRKLLQREAGDRFQNADALLEALDNPDQALEEQPAPSEEVAEPEDPTQIVTVVHTKTPKVPAHDASSAPYVTSESAAISSESAPSFTSESAPTFTSESAPTFTSESAPTLPDVPAVAENVSAAASTPAYPDFNNTPAPVARHAQPSAVSAPMNRRTPASPSAINKKTMVALLATGVLAIVAVSMVLTSKDDEPVLEAQAPVENSESDNEPSIDAPNPFAEATDETKENATDEVQELVASLNEVVKQDSRYQAAQAEKSDAASPPSSQAASPSSQTPAQATDTNQKAEQTRVLALAAYTTSLAKLDKAIAGIQGTRRSANRVDAAKFATKQYKSAQRKLRQIQQWRNQAIEAKNDERLDRSTALIEKAIAQSASTNKAFSIAKNAAVKNRPIAELEKKQKRLDMLTNTTNSLKETAISVGASILAASEFKRAKTVEIQALQYSQQMQQHLNKKDYEGANQAYAQAYNKLQLANRQYEKAIRTTKEKPRSAEQEFNILQTILHNFSNAYEQKDLAKLKSVSEMSDKRLLFVKKIFDRYEKIDVSITNIRLLQDSATATLVIDKLAQKDGGIGMISDNWKISDLKVKKDADGWGKVQWR